MEIYVLRQIYYVSNIFNLLYLLIRIYVYNVYTLSHDLTYKRSDRTLRLTPSIIYIHRKAILPDTIFKKIFEKFFANRQNR